MTCLDQIPQWLDVSIVGRLGTLRTKVIEVQLGRMAYHPSIPLRVFLGHPGQPGDSGALVCDLQGNGIGVYMGSLGSPLGHQEGFCQHLAQATHIMNLEPLI